MVTGTGDTVRERRYADTLREIKAAALAQMALSGATKMSLRGVARDVGMTVQSLYHYVDSYDALLTLLIIDSYDDLADVVERDAASTAGLSHVERLTSIVFAYRSWALENSAPFLLIYGTPVPGYLAPEQVGVAGWRQARAFVHVVYDGWSAEDLAAITAHPLDTSEPSRSAGADGPGARASEVAREVLSLPTPALQYFMELRATMHGLVMLELLGHLGPIPGSGAGLMRDFAVRASTSLSAMRGGSAH